MQEVLRELVTNLDRGVDDKARQFITEILDDRGVKYLDLDVLQRIMAARGVHQRLARKLYIFFNCQRQDLTLTGQVKTSVSANDLPRK